MSIISTLKRHPETAKSLTGALVLGGLTTESALCYNNYRKAIDNQIAEYNREAKKVAAKEDDPGYFDSMDATLEGKIDKLKGVKNTVLTASPFILLAASKLKDKVSPNTRDKVVRGLKDYAELAQATNEDNAPYDAKFDEKENFYIKAKKTVPPVQMVNEYMDNPSTPETSKYRKSRLGALVLGAGLGAAALYTSLKNKQALKDPQFGALLDSAASTVSQKDLQKLTGAAILNNATLLTTPLAGYYAYKNRDDKKKLALGLGMTGLSAGTYVGTRNYLQKTGPLVSSVTGSLNRLRELYPDHPEVHSKLSTMFNNYISNANRSDKLTVAATVPFMYGAENLGKIRAQRAIAEIQGDSDLSDEDKAKKIKKITQPTTLLNKYPYLQGMPFATVLDRRINKYDSN